MKSYHYRRPQMGDIVQIQRLLEELGYDVDEQRLENRVASLLESNDFVLVAEHQGRLDGIIQCLIESRLAEGVVGEIVTLVVTKAARRTGLGKTLLTKAINSLDASGCELIIVRTNEVRVTAKAFYHSQGFIEVKKQRVFELRVS